MQKFIQFILKLIKKIQKDRIFSLANELTYKLILAIFPFITFLMTLLGFFNIKIDRLITEAAGLLPPQLVGILETFLTEVLNQQHISLLSISLIVSIYSASSGFKAVINGINHAYEQKETRGFVKIRLISLGLVFLFALSIISSLILLIYGDFIISIISSHHYFSENYLMHLLNSLKFIAAIFILLVTVTLIYKFTCSKKVSFKNIIPGSIFTVALWVISSKAYSIYVESFANYSKVYGSIGNIFILLIWLNIISLCLLIGGEINAILENKN